jgi:hypothetical protein
MHVSSLTSPGRPRFLARPRRRIGFAEPDGREAASTGPLGVLAGDVNHC